MKKINSLIIEDTPMHRLTLKKHLGWSGYEIEIIGETGHVDEAYHLIKSLKPELIFLDIILEGGTAFDLLDKLLDDNLVNFKIIFISAYGGEDYVTNSLRFVSFDEYITKPIDTNELKNALELTIGNGFLDEVGKAISRKKLVTLLKNMKEKDSMKKETVIPLVKGSYIYLELSEISHLEADDPLGCNSKCR